MGCAFIFRQRRPPPPQLRPCTVHLYNRPLPLLMELKIYRVFIHYCVFSLKFRNFSELFQLCCSASVLPAWCVYTHWHQGKQRKARVRKNTIFNEHPVYIVLLPTTKSTYTTRANNAQWRAKQNQTTTTHQIDQTAYPEGAAILTIQRENIGKVFPEEKGGKIFARASLAQGQIILPPGQF